MGALRLAPEQLQQLRTFLDALGDMGQGLVVCDQTLSIRWVNHAVEEITERPSSELVELGSFLDIVAAEQREQVAERLIQLVDGEPNERCEMTLVRRDGQQAAALVAVRSVEVGGTPMLLLLLRDISEPRRTERELLLQKRRLAEAQALAHIGSWHWDRETGGLDWSDETYRLYGLEPEAPISFEDFMRYIHPDDRDRWRTLIEDRLSDRQPLVGEHRLIRPDGKLRWLSCRGRVEVDGEGRLLGMVGTSQDITALKEAESERRDLLSRLQDAREVERSRLAADLHDGPIQQLAALSFKIERALILLERPDQDGARELLAELKGDLTRQIASLRETMAELRPPALDQGGLEGALHDYLEQMNLDRSIQCTIESRVPEEIHGRLQTILYRTAREALANVASHAQASSVHIVIDRTDDDFVFMQIADDGLGFDPAQRRTGFGGGHLGLSAMRERVETAGGRLELESSPGSGTSIRAYVPKEIPS